MMLQLNWLSEPSMKSVAKFSSLLDDGQKVTPSKTISKWVDKMKSFSRKHKEYCCDADRDVKLHKTQTEIRFLTGSKYEGQFNEFGINGKGTYTFPDGVTYQGNFKDGVFNGKGSMKFPGGTVLKGPWAQGLIAKPSVVLQGELEYETEQRYCSMPDRRFCIERKRNMIEPAGRSYLTNHQPTRKIPDGHYDAGTGFYDPVRKDIVSYDDPNEVERAPTPKEQQWIEEHCRVAPDRTVGPNKKLYEQFAELKLALYDSNWGVEGFSAIEDVGGNFEREERFEASQQLVERKVLLDPLSASTRNFQELKSRIL